MLKHFSIPRVRVIIWMNRARCVLGFLMAWMVGSSYLDACAGFLMAWMHAQGEGRKGHRWLQIRNGQAASLIHFYSRY